MKFSGLRDTEVSDFLLRDDTNVDGTQPGEKTTKVINSMLVLPPVKSSFYTKFWISIKNILAFL